MNVFFIYSNVAVLLTAFAPLAVSLHRGINIGKQHNNEVATHNHGSIK